MMTVKEIIDKIVAERQTPGRFPSRLIFVRNFMDYITLASDLEKVCDVTLDLSKFAQGDIVPRFKDLKQELKKHNDKQVLLLSIGEYLRLCAKRETNKETSAFPGIWEIIQPERDKAKYIMPMFGGKELFDQVVPFLDERQKGFVWELTESKIESEYTITVYAPTFAGAIEADAANFQEWLEKWPALFGDPTRHSFSLMTRLHKYAAPTFGSVKVKIVDDPFVYVASLVTDGIKLKKEYGDERFWADVAKDVKHGESFSATVSHILNVGHSFDPVGILARFEHLSDTERRLFWLWYKLYPSEDYCAYAISKAETPENIPTMLRDTVFVLPKISESYATERINALRVLDLSYNEEYFAKLDNIAAPETRLSLLTYKTLTERSYAIKTISGLLRIGADISAIAKILRSGYPDLAEYLQPTKNGNNEISSYFDWYRQGKLINRPVTDTPYSVEFDDIESRNKVIQQSGECFSFWVDGLGVEWLPLLLSKLNKLSTPVSIVHKIAKSILPSETEYNHKWGNDEDKWDRLDKLSHSGMPDDKDYFLCIAQQIEIIGEVAEHVYELLAKHDRVLITSDHGSSRLAALMFHVSDNFAINPPKNALVRSFGRFCELKDNADVPLTPSMESVKLDGKTYIVMRTYEHFKQSGNAAGGNTDNTAVAGEIHGGMTPEEHLVPVIVISRKVPLAKPERTEDKKSRAADINDML